MSMPGPRTLLPRSGAWRVALRLFILAFPVWLAAAISAGEIEGVVEDPSGAAVPGARLKLRHRTTGQEFSASSKEAGQFHFTEVPVGRYYLRATARGFEQGEFPVSVSEAPSHPIRIRLEIAETADEVTVTAKVSSAPLAEQNLDSIDMDQTWLRDLPVKNGDPLAIPSMFVDPAFSGVGGPKIIVDGVESSTLDVPSSSIKKVSVNRDPYSAEFGRPGRGRIEVTTKKGVHRRYRSNLSLLLRNSTFDARNAFAQVRPPMQRAVSEAELDGPLGQRATFFVAARYYLNNEWALINAQTPAGRLVENFETPERKAYFIGRFDYRFNPAHKLTARYRFKRDSRRNQGIGGFDLPERATDYLERENEVKIYETAIVSTQLMNDLRVAYKRKPLAINSLTGAPAIIVLDAFKAGGGQLEQRQTQTSGEVQDLVTFVTGRHNIRFGGGFRPRFFDIYNPTNFGGTFTFSSLESFRENRPFTFAINQGDPRFSFHWHEFYSFIQDEVRLRSDLSVSLGLRHEFQSNLGDHNNLAPRLALAYAPGGGRTVLRAGSGIFYDRQPEIMPEQSALYGGFRVRQLVISNPPFPLATDHLAATTFQTPSVVRIGREIRAPYLMQASFGVERRLGAKRSYVAVEYMTLRGLKLYRTHNINAPRPDTGARVDSSFININQFESTGTSRGNSLRVTFQGQISTWLDILSQYTLSRTRDDTAGLFSLPADNFNFHPEYGRSEFDRRHQWNLISTARLPMRFELGTITRVASGIPFNVTTGFDANLDTVANDRPPGVGRNTGHGPGLVNVDVRLSKRLHLPKREWAPHEELYLDLLNALNHVNFKNYVGNLSSPFFGKANAALGAREVQISLKVRF